MRGCRRLLLFMLILGGTAYLNGQYSKEFKRIYIDAQTLYETGFYDEAFTRFKDLLNLEPDNHNILFLCGACCLNIQGNEELAVEYLEKASEGVTLKYKEKSPKEKGAPVLAYFMLGRAYHLTNAFDKAIPEYERYLETRNGQDQVQMEYARLQIEACERALEVDMDRPSFEFRSLLDYFADALPSCSNPVVSGDGNVLIFLAKSPTDQKIMMTTRRNDLWSRPRVINSEIGMVGETYPVSISYDGKELYLVHHYYSHSDVLVSRFENGRWMEADPLGHNINGRTSETHASISKDGQTLYFTSDARGSLGSYDIFLSRLGANGTWGPPENLGPVINTPYEEHTPFISSNDSILFFSSQGHNSIGGIDVFYSRLQEDGTWGEPVNIGIPVNSSGDDVFFNPGWNEMDGYFAVRKEEDPSSNAINRVIELDPEMEHTASVEDTTEQDEGIQEAVAEEMTETIQTGREPSATDPTPTVLPATLSEVDACIPFDYGSYRMNLAARVEAEKLADHLKANPGIIIELTGHADAMGGAEDNMMLSFRRVNIVTDYLVSNGVEPERIRINASGEGAPVARNIRRDGTDEPLGRFMNRMVTVRLNGPVPLDAGLYGAYVPQILRPDPGVVDYEDLKTFTFTIQVAAGLKPLNMSRFRELGTVEEHICNDDYYRYTYGNFMTAQEARQALSQLKSKGYPEAYVRTREWFYSATR